MNHFFLYVASILAILINIQSINGQFVQIPDQLSGLWPSSLLDFYNDLTPKQEKIIDEAVGANDGNEDGFIGYIKRKDRKLGIRAERFFKDFIDRLTRLKEPAWEFYLTLFNALHQFDDSTDEATFKRFTRSLLYKWIGMKRSARHSLATEFPSTAHALNSQRVRDFAEFII